MVPRARIELATQGFSVLCSTTELPRPLEMFELLDRSFHSLVRDVGIVVAFPTNERSE